MAQVERVEVQQIYIQHIRLKSTERDCPQCDAVLIHNDHELCYECLDCGYIDCGDDNEN